MNKNKEVISQADDKLISYPIASKSTRIFACALDCILVMALALMLLSTFVIPKKYSTPMKELQHILHSYSETISNTDKKIAENFSSELKDMIESIQAFVVLAFWLYFSITEIFMNGATLGKKVFSLRAISLRTGQKPHVFDSCLRGGIKTLSLLAFFPLLLINYFLIFFPRVNRTGHDFLCNTVVVVTTPEEEDE